jgi:hypothetical protein
MRWSIVPPRHRRRHQQTPTSVAVDQQNFAGRPFAVLLLHARSNRLVDPIPLVPSIIQAFETTRPGDIVHIGA